MSRIGIHGQISGVEWAIRVISGGLKPTASEKALQLAKLRAARETLDYVGQEEGAFRLYLRERRGGDGVCR